MTNTPQFNQQNNKVQFYLTKGCHCCITTNYTFRQGEIKEAFF